MSFFFQGDTDSDHTPRVDTGPVLFVSQDDTSFWAPMHPYGPSKKGAQAWQARLVTDRRRADEYAPDILVRDLASVRWEHRVRALQALAAGGPDLCRRFQNRIQEALDDPIDVVRVTAIEALGVLAEQRSIVQRLFHALHDSSWEVRVAAVALVERLGDHPPIDLLIETFYEDDDENVREAIVRVLGRQGARMPVQFLCHALRFDPNWLVREAAAWALGQLEAQAPLKDLLDVLHDDDDEMVRAAAIRALGRTGQKRVETVLFSQLDEDDDGIREAAVWALQQLDEETRGLPHQDQPWSSTMQDVVLKLTDFIQEKKGYIEPPIVYSSAGKQVLVIQCTYQSQEHLIQHWTAKTAQAVVQPLEQALWQHDETIYHLVERAAQEWEARPWHDFLIVSFTLEQKTGHCEHQPLQVVLSSMGYPHLPEKGSLLLPQLLTLFENVMQRPNLVCHCMQKPQMKDMHIWHQPAASPPAIPVK